MEKKPCKHPRSGFTMIVLLIAVSLFVLLAVFAMTRTMKQVNTGLDPNDQLENPVPAPTIQNYQQTLDSVKENINQNVGKEQQKLNDAQKEME